MKRVFAYLVLLHLLFPRTVVASEMSDREIQRHLYGDLVENEATAIGLAEALIRGKYGDEALRVLQPMDAHVAGEFWVVEGRWKRPFPVIVRINKIDAHITLFYFEWVSDPQPMPPPPQKHECGPECHRAPATR